jgi:hypothetical protein
VRKALFVFNNKDVHSWPSPMRRKLIIDTPT